MHVVHEHQLHLLALIETMHEDSHCVTVKILRILELNVLEAPKTNSNGD